jgi:RNA polymerase sigma-70 factor (ECF subfamily)
LNSSPAFDELYADLRPTALRIARSVLADEQAAEDVVQEVFLHLWQRPSAYDPSRGSLRVYVGMLTRSRAVDHWRSRAARETAVQRAARELEARPQFGESSAAPVIRRDRRRRLLDALQAIPLEQRDALLLRYAGLSATEIAQHVQLPEGTAKSRIRLGLEKVRTLMGEAA